MHPHLLPLSAEHCAVIVIKRCRQPARMSAGSSVLQVLRDPYAPDVPRNVTSCAMLGQHVYVGTQDGSIVVYKRAECAWCSAPGLDFRTHTTPFPNSTRRVILFKSPHISSHDGGSSTNFTAHNSASVVCYACSVWSRRRSGACAGRDAEVGSHPAPHCWGDLHCCISTHWSSGGWGFFPRSCLPPCAGIRATSPLASSTWLCCGGRHAIQTRRVPSQQQPSAPQ